MSKPFEYSYNPQWSTYHAQASANASYVPYQYDIQQQQQHIAPPTHSSLGPSPHRTFETGNPAHAVTIPSRRGRLSSATRTCHDSSDTNIFPASGVRSFPRPHPAISAQWVLQNPGRSWDASMPPPLQLEYLPRRPENSGYTSEQPVHFNSHRLPGPYVQDILSNNPGLDDAEATVFEHTGCKRVQWTFDFPGLSLLTRRIPVIDNNRHLTRLEIAREICSEIVRTMRSAKSQKSGIDNRWRLDKCSHKHLRLVALAFHGSSWVPVLAVDA
ncbi:hypothetical protein J3R30DRAFT_556759 [Lentinula aciculospora]|uniref:Uncharacterized protein n=1 Tax=Lentinula aciculospora TaxID=153920 RepID=A0A9W9A691_9AGAR|nr:hypothetical protein J3R30DRAFT_556759 [Lentinula aciculospora]